MATPSDNFYNLQWHFNLIGDIETIWDEYTGLGLKIGVYDDGIDTNHVDLSANYDSSLEVKDDNGDTLAPIPETSGDGHGTSVAGLIAAANNGTGVVGVAHGASITGVNIFGANTYGYVNASTFQEYQEFLDVVSQALNFDIMNNSWGSAPVFHSSGSLVNVNSGDYYLSQEYKLLSQSGRVGLGTIIAQAAGNNNLDANGDGTNASRFTLTVAATDSNGIAASYSNFGQSILVAAPAGSVTTDRTDGDGYNSAVGGDAGEISDNDYTQQFGGTSAATPITSGVIALMLEANSNLGWRDVQNILAKSATFTGDGYFGTVGTNEDGFWFLNAADNWNGGGMHFHVNYGYGMINVHGAVRMAEAWAHFDIPLTSANEIQVTSSAYTSAGGTPIPDNSSSGVTFSLLVTQNVEIEHVGLILDITHSWIGDLQILLTSAEGTTITVKSVGYGLGVTGGWYYGIDSLLGENAYGTWTVTVSDLVSGLTGNIFGGYLEVYGSTINVDDVYTYTDEITIAITLDPSRLSLSDTNGGSDWLNFASITLDLIVDLATNGTGTATLDGTTIVNIVSGTEIENVHGGDGDDQLTGNSLNNEIVGGRGNDEMNGAEGDDIIYAGQGDDFINGGSSLPYELGLGSAPLNTSGGIDTLALSGSFFDYALSDGIITDANGTYRVGYITDLNLSDGDDGTDTFTNIDILEFSDLTFNLVIGTGSGEVLSGNAQDDIVLGFEGNDNLFGQLGSDYFKGGEGNDRFIGNNWQSEGNTADIDTVVYDGNYTDYEITRFVFINSFRTILAYSITDSTNGGFDGVDEGADTLYDIDTLIFNDQFIDLSAFDYVGTSGNDIIGASNFDGDFLEGLSGNDNLFGKLGSDFFNGGEGNDKFIGNDWRSEGNSTDIDTVIYDGNFADYTITRFTFTNAFRSITAFRVNDTASGGFDGVNEGQDYLYDIDTIVFQDQTIDLADLKFEYNGTSGNDIVGASSFDNDLLNGFAGNDNLFGKLGSDFFHGGEGNDKFIGNDWRSEGNSTDIDTVIYDGNFVDYTITRFTFTNAFRSITAFRVNDTAGGGFDGVDEGQDYLYDIDIIVFNDLTIDLSEYTFDYIGTAGNDIIGASNFDNDFLSGLAGNDNLFGKLGSDFFNGGEGDDKFIGNNWVSAGNSTDIDTVIYGGYLTDYSFSYVNYTNAHRSGIAFFIEDDASGGNDGIDEGTDTLYDIDFVEFSDGNIIDVNAILIGDNTDNTLIGDARDNIFIGEGGADTFTGNAGLDTFFFKDLSESTSTDTDVITDFTQGEDIIAMFELNIAFSDLNISDNGIDTTVGVNGTSFEVKLNGVLNLTEDDFLL